MADTRPFNRLVGKRVDTVRAWYSLEITRSGETNKPKSVVVDGNIIQSTRLLGQSDAELLWSEWQLGCHIRVGPIIGAFSLEQDKQLMSG